MPGLYSFLSFLSFMLFFFIIGSVPGVEADGAGPIGTGLFQSDSPVCVFQK